MANTACPINRSIFVPLLFVIRFVRIQCTVCYQFRLIFPLQKENWRKDRFELCERQFGSSLISFPLSISRCTTYCPLSFQREFFFSTFDGRRELFVFSRVDLPHAVNYRSFLFCTTVFQAIESNSLENDRKTINCYIFPKKKNGF